MTPLRLFNGPIEVGLRALVLLVEAYPKDLDLQQLVTFDYFLVHSGDTEGGPDSIHPPSPLRSGEVAVRRALIEDGLNFYRLRGLLRQQLSTSGFTYIADDSAASLLDAIQAPYVGKLRERAEWVMSNFGSLESEELQRTLENSLSRWNAEFALEEDIA